VHVHPSPRAEKKIGGQIYREKLQVYPMQTECAPQAEEKSNFLRKLGDLDRGIG